MPISDPFPQRKVPPEANAFEMEGRRGASSVTYQQGLRDAVTQNTTIIVADEYALRRGLQSTTGNVHRAEARAKDYVEDFGHVFDWDIRISQTLEWNAWAMLQCPTEVLRTTGARYAGLLATMINPRWHMIVAPGCDGDWLMGASIRLKVGGGVPIVTEVRLGIFKNGILLTELDAESDNNYGTVGINDDAILNGMRPVNVAVGDRIEFGVKLVETTPLSGLIVFGYPSSVVGYVWGARQRCGVAAISTPDDQSGYVF